VNYSEPLWLMLERLLMANAPSGGANLLGGVGDDIAVLADDLNLRDRVTSHLGSTGNTAIWLGTEKAAADLVIVAHMDRPSYRVRSLVEGTLYPICANRFPPGDYRVEAKGVRFDRGRLVVGVEGVLISHKEAGQESLRFEAKRGTLAWHDTVLLGVHPVCDGERVVGTGLDNSLGVLVMLLTAAVLRDVEGVMRERERRCLFVFTDQEEGPPEGFFGHGAARLAYTIPPPTYGCIVVDGHNAALENGVRLGGGASHGVASNWGRGSIVPPNYHALAVELAQNLNDLRPGTVQMNNGYLSRSDDMMVGRWARVLGLIGPPLTDAHTGQESAMLGDVQASVWWLAHYVVTVLNLVPELTPRYALGR